MSECIGVGCTHESHTHMQVAKSEESSKVRTRHKPLTKNQRKTKRRKGIKGY